MMPMMPMATPARGGGVAIVLVVVIGLLVLGGAGAVLLFARAPGQAPPSTPQQVAVPATVATVEPPTAAPTSKPKSKKGGPRWASNRAFPIGVDVDGDGTEDVIGPTVHVEGANPQIYVTAFDGKTFAVKHEVGPFGKAGNDIDSAAQIAVAGQRFVVLDPKGDAHLYELATGKLVADFPFREENHGLCGPPAFEPKVLIRVGKGDFIIDAATAIGKPGTEPAWCAGDRYMRRRISESYNVYFGCQAELWQQDGFTREKLEALKPPPKTSLDFAYVDGPLTVAVATQAGGEGWTLIGFDARGAITYQVPGSAIGLPGTQREKDLAFGRFVFASTKRSIVALDAKTGDKLWEAKAAQADANVGRMSLTEKRIWVVRWKSDDVWVEALDAATGKLVGSAGN